VNVTDVPEQILLALAAIVTTGVTVVVTTIVIIFEISVVDVTHESVEVIIADTASPLASVLDVNVGPDVTTIPFTLH
jgi:acetolactate synthase small subunit